MLKNAYRAYKATDNKLLEDSLDDFVVRTANRYTAEFVAKNPIKVYVFNPLKRMKKYLISSGSTYLLFDVSHGMRLHHILVRLLAFIAYYTILLYFVFAAFLLFSRKVRDAFSWSLFIACMVNILFISLIAGMQESRYVLPIIPLMLVLSSVVFIKWKSPHTTAA